MKIHHAPEKQARLAGTISWGPLRLMSIIERWIDGKGLLMDKDSQKLGLIKLS